MIDLDFYPVNPFTVLKPAPSMVSVFDKLCTISDSKPHFEHSDTDSDSQSEVLEIDPNNKLMDTLLDNNSTGTDSATPENNTHLDNCVTNTVGQGYVASKAHQTMASVSTDICAETEGHSFPVIEESESFVLDLEEDVQNDDVWNSEMEPTIVSKVVKKTTSYVHSEDLLEGSHGSVSALNLSNHIPESNAPTLDNCITSTTKQGYVDSEACQTMASLSLDIPAAKCLAVNRTDTVANNFVKQSSSYVRSEDLLEGSHGSVSALNLNNHIPASDIPTINNSIMNTSKQGYVDSETCQTMANGSTGIFSRTDNIFPASEEPVSLALDLDEDDQNIPLEIEPSSNGDLCPDVPAFNCSATGASNFVEQSSNYVRSEDLLEGRESVFVFDSNDHIPESNALTLDNCITSTNKQGYVDAEACQTMASVSLDIPAAKCPAIDQNDTPASNFVEQSSSYVCSEDLLEGNCEFIPASDCTPGDDDLNCVMNTNERGYVDSKAHQNTTSASPEIFVRTDDTIFPASEEPVSLALDLDEDDQNIPLEIELSSHGDLCPDFPAFNCSAIDTGASNFVEQSSNYVRSEDLLEGRESVFVFNSNDHIPESNALTLDNCITSTNKQGYVDAEACQTMASVSLDIPAAKCPAIDQNDTPASNFVEQSSSYVRNENLHVGIHSREFVPAFDHIPESDLPSLDSCIMTTNEQGYVDSEACQNMTSVSPGLFVERETGNFATCEETVSLVLDLDEDDQNNNSEQVPPSGDSSSDCHCPDIPASSWFSATEPSPSDHSKTATSNPANSNYICTEDLLVGRHGTVHSKLDSNDHICDSEFLPSICLEEAADQESLSTKKLESKNEGYYVPPKELLKPSSSYLSETSLLASARPDVLSIQDPEASSLHSGTEDSLSICTMSPQSVFSEHYRTIPHQTLGYFDYTTNSYSSPLKMQHPSTSSGYVTDNSTAGDEVPFSMVH